MDPTLTPTCALEAEVAKPESSALSPQCPGSVAGTYVGCWPGGENDILDVS
jgi:hypothetical protein